MGNPLRTIEQTAMAVAEQSTHQLAQALGRNPTENELSTFYSILAGMVEGGAAAFVARITAGDVQSLEQWFAHKRGVVAQVFHNQQVLHKQKVSLLLDQNTRVVQKEELKKEKGRLAAAEAAPSGVDPASVPPCTCETKKGFCSPCAKRLEGNLDRMASQIIAFSELEAEILEDAKKACKDCEARVSDVVVASAVRRNGPLLKGSMLHVLVNIMGPMAMERLGGGASGAPLTAAALEELASAAAARLAKPDGPASPSPN